MAKNKTKSKSKNKGEVASIPSTQQRVDWRICINCGCYEPFERRTEECCWNEFGKECVFITRPTAVELAAAVKLAKGKPDQLE